MSIVKSLLLVSVLVLGLGFVTTSADTADFISCSHDARPTFWNPNGLMLCQTAYVVGGSGGYYPTPEQYQETVEELRWEAGSICLDKFGQESYVINEDAFWIENVSDPNKWDMVYEYSCTWPPQP